MHARLGQIFYGLLIVGLDFKFNQFDVLPDCVGYAMAAIGCSGLIQVSRQFLSSGLLCLLLAAFSLAEFVARGNAALFLGYLEFPANGAMHWLLLGGIAELAIRLRRPDLTARAKHCRLAYVILMGIAFMLREGADAGYGVAAWLFIPLVIAFLVNVFLILQLIYRVRHAAK